MMKKHIYLVLLILLLFLSACEIKNPIEGVAVLLNQAPIETVVTVEFRDTKTDTQIGSSQPHNIFVTIEGRDRDKIVNMSNQSVESFTTETGVINFSIISGFTPGKQNPVNIIIHAVSEDFLEISHPITINKSGGSSFSVNMVNKSEPPQGGCVSTNIPLPANSGTLTSDFMTASCVENLTDSYASILIAKGTKIKDASQSLLTGTLKLDISYFNGQSGEAISAFPGGLSVKFKTANSNAIKTGIFSSIGFVNFEISNENGNRAKYFDSGATFQILIPDGTINPQTGNKIKTGDAIPIWSLNESEGTWVLEKSEIVKQTEGEDSRSVYINTQHLSWWNLGWVNEDICESGCTINFSGNFSSLRIKAKKAANNEIILNRKIITSTDPSYTFTNVPQGIPVIVEVYNNLECNNTPVETFNIPDLCADEYNFEVNLEGINVNVIVDAICTDRDPVLKIRPNANIYIQNDCNELILIGQMEKGHMQLKALKRGKTYIFAVEYEGKWYTEPAVVNDERYYIEYELPIEVCDDY